MRYNGPAATSPVIRGLPGERVLVLQDGDRAADLSSAAPDHGVSIDPLTARVDNALDQKYADATSRIKTFALNPGRNIARLQGPVSTARQCA
jgi:hypothetical protein